MTRRRARTRGRATARARLRVRRANMALVLVLALSWTHDRAVMIIVTTRILHSGARFSHRRHHRGELQHVWFAYEQSSRFTDQLPRDAVSSTPDKANWRAPWDRSRSHSRRDSLIVAARLASAFAATSSTSASGRSLRGPHRGPHRSASIDTHLPVSLS